MDYPEYNHILDESRHQNKQQYLKMICLSCLIQNINGIYHHNDHHHILLYNDKCNHCQQLRKFPSYSMDLDHMHLLVDHNCHPCILLRMCRDTTRMLNSRNENVYYHLIHMDSHHILLVGHGSHNNRPRIQLDIHIHHIHHLYFPSYRSHNLYNYHNNKILR